MKQHNYRHLYNVPGIHGFLAIYVYPCKNGTIIINFPGFNSDGRGYNDKYITIAEMLVEQKVGAVVRMSNPHLPTADYPGQMIRNLQTVIRYCLRNAIDICGSPNPIVYLMGNSAGASVVVAECGNYPQVKKILLTSLSFDVDDKDMAAGLAKFTGQVYATYGNNDINIGLPSAQWLKSVMGEANKNLRLVRVPDCGHEFEGTINSQVLSKAPLWAFAGNRTFPSPNGGIKLY